MNSDKFVVIQSWLNVCEGTIAMIAVALCLFGRTTMGTIGALLCLIVSAFVFWKTIIFVWYDNDYLSVDAKNYTT
jgi:hypothetical protein